MRWLGDVEALRCGVRPGARLGTLRLGVMFVGYKVLQSHVTAWATERDPRRFVRVHRSFIVNLRQVHALERTESSGHAVRLKSGKRILVSRSGHERLLAVL